MAAAAASGAETMPFPMTNDIRGAMEKFVNYMLRKIYGRFFKTRTWVAATKGGIHANPSDFHVRTVWITTETTFCVPLCKQKGDSHAFSHSTPDKLRWSLSNPATDVYKLTCTCFKCIENSDGRAPLTPGERALSDVCTLDVKDGQVLFGLFRGYLWRQHQS